MHILFGGELRLRPRRSGGGARWAWASTCRRPRSTRRRSRRPRRRHAASLLDTHRRRLRRLPADPGLERPRAAGGGGLPGGVGAVVCAAVRAVSAPRQSPESDSPQPTGLSPEITCNIDPPQLWQCRFARVDMRAIVECAPQSGQSSAARSGAGSRRSGSGPAGWVRRSQGSPQAGQGGPRSDARARRSTRLASRDPARRAMKKPSVPSRVRHQLEKARRPRCRYSGTRLPGRRPRSPGGSQELRIALLVLGAQIVHVE